MIDKLDLLTYLIFVAIVVVCAVKMGLLVRVRFAVGHARGTLLSILTENNLTWCAIVVVEGVIVMGRVFGVLPPIVGRFGILVVLLLTSVFGLIRLGHWMIFDDGKAVMPSTVGLSLDEEIVRLSLRLEEYRRLRAAERLAASGEGP